MEQTTPFQLLLATWLDSLVALALRDADDNDINTRAGVLLALCEDQDVGTTVDQYARATILLLKTAAATARALTPPDQVVTADLTTEQMEPTARLACQAILATANGSDATVFLEMLDTKQQAQDCLATLVGAVVNLYAEVFRLSGTAGIAWTTI